MNFKWIEIDALKELEEEIYKRPSLDIRSHLPTPDPSPREHQQSQFRDIESEFQRIVREAKQEESETRKRSKANKNEDDQLAVRKSRRLARKSNDPSVTDQEIQKTEGRVRLLSAMRRKRSRNARFGKITLCLDCCNSRLNSVTLLPEVYERLCHASMTHSDKDFEGLEHYVCVELQDKVISVLRGQT